MYRTILLATDGSDDALGAAERAVDLAARYGAELSACYVIESRTAYDNAIVEPETVDRALREEGEAALAAVAELATAEGVPVRGAIRRGVPHEELLEQAEQAEADLLVVGRQGRSSFRAVLLGSTTDALVRLSPVPVLVAGEPTRSSGSANGERG
jgi:nucleotide-binding universal stress UspA family protein